jgi:hypothetical protein
MEGFLSPSTRLELLRFRNWEEWFAEVAEGVCGAETGATSVRITHSHDLGTSQSPAAAPPPQ